MKAATSAVGATLLCLAGWFALVSWACSKASDNLAPIEGLR